MQITLYVLNYNYGIFLQECLDSVLKQTDRAFEVILVDNGSSDGSADMMCSLAHDEGWRFMQFPNISLGTVGNQMLRLASGEYVVRLDADDFLKEDYIEQMKRIINEQRPDLIFGNFFYVDGASRIYGRHDCLPRGRETNGGYHDEPLHGACTLIRVSSFIAQGGYDENLPCQDGFDLYLKMRSSRISLLDDHCFYYRRGHRSLSSRKQRIFSTRNTIIERQFARQKLTLPPCCVYLICPSGIGVLPESKKAAVLKLVDQVISAQRGLPVALILGADEDLSLWPTMHLLDYWQWMPSEANSISAQQMIARLNEHYRPELYCTVNVGEPLAPVDYVWASLKYTVMMETDGAITGARFDHSLFRPVFGGVTQVSPDHATHDLNRWVIHSGGITCLRHPRPELRATYSVLEVETAALTNWIDHVA